jgi:hypothetical protein
MSPLPVALLISRGHSQFSSRPLDSSSSERHDIYNLHMLASHLRPELPACASPAGRSRDHTSEVIVPHSRRIRSRTPLI